MIDSVKKITDEVLEHCLEYEGVEVKRVKDNVGNECLEWETKLRLEVTGVASDSDEELKKHSITMKAQFDLSFDEANKKIYYFLQWGRVEKKVWEDSAKAIEDAFMEYVEANVRFNTDREVVELSIKYPFHEFDFDYVYKEAISYFALVNRIFYENAS